MIFHTAGIPGAPRLQAEEPGMETPRLPPGQTLTTKWPVLYYGGIPRIDLAKWAFAVEGEVESSARWT